MPLPPHIPDQPRAGAPRLSPILGLPIEDEPASVPSATLPEEPGGLRLSVILPARNEEQNLPGCLASLLAQNDALFPLGTDWELLLVDDASTDGTPALIAAATAANNGVRAIIPADLDLRTSTGKSNACWAAAQQARGRVLLFTDADTLHEPGSLKHALFEAEKYNAALLSYSPRQIVHGLFQHALMPLIFSELASVYRMDEVNDPNRRLAAANGQFLLVDRKAYFAVGGHAALGNTVLEDVALAQNLKQSKRILRFRYAPDAVSARMYRGTDDMLEGWNKNLALLFPHALALAAWRLLDVLLLCLPLLFFVMPFLVPYQKVVILALWARTLLRFFTRVRRSNFPWLDCLLSVLALPVFIAMLVRSWFAHRIFHQVAWKGREYRTRR